MFTRILTTEPRLPVQCERIPSLFGDEIVRITTQTSGGTVSHDYHVERRPAEPGLPWSVILRYGTEEYLVGVMPDGLTACTCLDYEMEAGRMGVPCKHAASAIRLGLIPDPTQPLPQLPQPKPENLPHGHENRIPGPAERVRIERQARADAEARREVERAARIAAERAERRRRQDAEDAEHERSGEPLARERI